MRWIRLSICLLFITGVVNAQDEVVVPFAQVGLNAIFMVDAAANRTTAMYSFSYTTPPDDAIRWVLPLPPGSDSVRLGDSEMVMLAQYLTEPNIEPPQKPCELSPKFSFADGVVPGPYYWGSVRETLHMFSRTEEVQAFVADGGFSLNAGAASALDAYAEQGYSFAGLTVSPDREASAPYADDMGRSTDVYLSPLVVAEYPGTEPILPLGFRSTAVATYLDGYNAEAIMPVTAYIFADLPYQSANAGVFQPDLTQMPPGENELANTMRLIDGGGPFAHALDYAYYGLIQQDMDEMDRLAFALEFVGQPDNANRFTPVGEEGQASLDAINRQWASYPILTRLRTFIQTDQVVPDVVFTPSPGETDFQVNLSEAIDPVWYWGCTSRRLYDPALEARLPAGRTYIEDLRLSLAHPEGWQLIALDWYQRRIYVISPETVTVDDLDRMESGGDGPPMLVSEAVQTRYDEKSYCGLFDPTWERFIRITEGAFRRAPARNGLTIIWPDQFIWSSCDAETVPIDAVKVVLLSSFADWAANESLYNDMLAYAGTYQFYLSAGLRHTLFLRQLSYPVALGYPDGWLENGTVDGDRVLMPADAVYDHSPAARIRSIYPKDEAPATLAAWYGVPDSLDLSVDQVIPFETDERRGYIVWLAGSEMPTIEFSAPNAQFAEYTDLLRLMASSVRTEWGESPELR
jgi:hypothetical protein